MENLNHYVKQILRNLTDLDVDNWELMDEFEVISRLVEIIDHKFFNECNWNWIKLKEKIEAFLSLNGIQEKLDMDILGL